MIERFKQGKLIWIALKNPTAQEVQKVMSELDIVPTLMADLTTPVPNNSAVRVGDTIKITLDFPDVKRLSVEQDHEIKFVILKHSLVTIQYEEMEGIDRFKRQFEVATTLRKTQRGITGAHLFISLMGNLYETSSSKLDYVESKLNGIEDKIFRANGAQLVIEISQVSKMLIMFRHVIRSHEGIFREAKPFFDEVYGNIFSEALQKIQVQYFLLLQRSNTFFETLTALRETNTAMLTTRQNEIIKNLTLMAFITYPLTLLSSMFGMNVTSAPIIGHAGDFWVIVVIMLLGATGFFMFFRYKGWV